MGYVGVAAIRYGQTSASIWIRVQGWQAICAGIIMFSWAVFELVNRYRELPKREKGSRIRGIWLIVTALVIILSPLFTFPLLSIAIIHRVLVVMSIILLCFLGHALNGEGV